MSCGWAGVVAHLSHWLAAKWGSELSSFGKHCKEVGICIAMLPGCRVSRCIWCWVSWCPLVESKVGLPLGIPRAFRKPTYPANLFGRGEWQNISVCHRAAKVSFSIFAISVAGVLFKFVFRIHQLYLNECGVFWQCCWGIHYIKSLENTWETVLVICDAVS